MSQVQVTGFEKMLKTCLLLLLLINEAKGQPVKRIFNGTYDLNVPYYVQLITKRKHVESFLCGGVIVANDLVLTAAHCLQDIRKESLRVISGGQLRKLTEEYHKVSDFITHENYNPKTFENDIALIKLRDIIKFNGEQEPILIRSTPIMDGEILKISGMGAFNQRGIPSQVLQSTLVPVVNREYCQAAYYPDVKLYKIYENMFCLGSEETHACTGDSGGPAVDLVNGAAQLVGIVSWGQPMTCSNGPDVYTNVVNYRYWVEDHINYEMNDIDDWLGVVEVHDNYLGIN